MPDIDNYSRSALERSGKCITRYSKIEYDGYIEIDYQEKDRVEGAIIGGAAGALTGAAVCAYFVPGVGIVAGTVLTTAAAGAAAGAYIGTHYDYTYYFDTKTGEFLSTDRDIAKRKVSERRRKRNEEKRESKASEYYRKATAAWKTGLQKESAGQSDEARNKFEEAYELYTAASELAPRNRTYDLQKDVCSEKISHVEEAAEHYEEAETAWNEGQRAEALGRSNEATNKFRQAYELYTSASNLAPHNSNYSSHKTTCKKRIEELEKASGYYNQATAAWEEGWSAELSGQSDRAINKFRQAYELYTSASNRAPHNSNYTLGKQKCKDKIDGNTLFNQGLELQEKANRFNQEKQYTEALQSYEQAKAKFCEGFQKSQDIRFRDCENIVTECIDGVRRALERQNVTNSIASLNFNHQCSNNQEQTTNAQSHVDNQVSMMLDVKI